MANRTWTTQYYDAVEYYFWGPDKLNARRDPTKTGGVGKVLERLQRLEEPLNHCLTLFLELAPDTLRRDLAVAAAGLDTGLGTRVGDRATHGMFDGRNVVQPDVLLSGREAVLAVEVKLGSRSSLEQVLKYALLLSRISDGRRYALVYLTEKPFAWHWRDVSSPEEVKRAARARLAEVEKLGALRLDEALRSEVILALNQLVLAAWTFSELAHRLETWVERLGEGPSDETLRNLCFGLQAELHARGLA